MLHYIVTREGKKLVGLKVSTIAKLLDMHEQSIYSIVTKGDMKSVNYGRPGRAKYIILPEQFQEYLKAEKERYTDHIKDLMKIDTKVEGWKRYGT